VDTSSIDALRTMTTDDINDQVKLAAAQALQRLKDELGFEFVFRVVGDSSKPELRAAAFAELSALGDTNFLKNIVAATEDKEPPLVRAAAILALGELSSKEGAPKIVAAAKDKDPSVRLAAARSLALINAPGALSALSDLLSDAEASVRVQASVSLLSRRESPPEAED
jgi:HEAT repeat protein